MGLSDLDGFLTGIAVGRELILPSEWLSVIWGGDEPVFDTESQMRGHRCGPSWARSWAATMRSSPASMLTRKDWSQSSGKDHKAT
jgi:hypothetical protein